MGRRKKQAGTRYYGFGQKSGFSLNKDGTALCQFNYDNYGYAPNNPSLPTYISVPLQLEVCVCAPRRQQPDPCSPSSTQMHCLQPECHDLNLY